MAVASVWIGLQAMREDLRDARGVTASEFLDPLRIQTGEVEAASADGRRWGSASICFAVVRYGEFSHIDTTADAGAQNEAFFAVLWRRSEP